MNGRRIVAALVAVLWIGSASADTFRCTVPTDEVLNVRVQPNKQAATEGRRLFRDDKVDGTLSDSGKWVAYKDGDVTVYASSAYMEQVVDVPCYVVGSGRVRWRKSPGGKVGGYYKPGDQVTVYGIAQDSDGSRWARISESRWAISGGHYVMLDYLQNEDGDCLADLY